MKVFLASRAAADIRKDWRYASSAGRLISPPLVDKKEMWNFREENCLYGRHELTGPYYTEDGRLNGVDAEHCAILTMTSILQSDLVFAWLDDPDPDAFWALGFAQSSEVRTAVGSSAPLAHSHVFCSAVDFRSQTNIPPESLLRAITDAESTSKFLGGTWKKMTSKFNGVCDECNTFYSEGETIMWKRLKRENGGTKKSTTMHVECFMYGAPTEAIPRDLQATAVELLKKRLAALEEKNRRLFETVRDLAGSSP